MPDRHLDDQGRVILDPEPDYHDERAIIACGMCDDEGYRGGTVCDHIDHVSTTERGRGLMRAEGLGAAVAVATGVVVGVEVGPGDR